jgi:hypothetical protein
MTTHETRPEAFDTTADSQTRQDPAMETVGPTGDFERAQDVVASPSHEPRESTETTADSPDRTLVADGDLTDMRSRWTEVQSAFVDDPRDCVQKADALVADVVDRLTAQFAQARSRLEEQWSRGEQVSTEDLRLALQRYRDFFERLLAV